MDETFLPVEDYLLQRGRMMLIDTIIKTDGQNAVTRSVTTELWPLYKNGYISPIVIIELVAQTAGVGFRWEEKRKHEGREERGGGLMVGVKDAVFFAPCIPLNATIITYATEKYVYMNYAEYYGYSTMGDAKLGEATLQLLKTD